MKGIVGGIRGHLWIWMSVLSISVTSWGLLPKASSIDVLNTETAGPGVNTLNGALGLSKLLLSLPGRAGLDVNLVLHYNSKVWFKSGAYIPSSYWILDQVNTYYAICNPGNDNFCSILGTPYLFLDISVASN